MFYVPWEGIRKEGESTFKKAQGFLEEFPNLIVGRLLPDLDPKEKKLTITEIQEWTVIVFLRGQGHWRRVI